MPANQIPPKLSTQTTSTSPEHRQISAHTSSTLDCPPTTENTLYFNTFYVELPILYQTLKLQNKENDYLTKMSPEDSAEHFDLIFRSLLNVSDKNMGQHLFIQVKYVTLFHKRLSIQLKYLF